MGTAQSNAQWKTAFDPTAHQTPVQRYERFSRFRIRGRCSSATSSSQPAPRWCGPGGCWIQTRGRTRTGGCSQRGCRQSGGTHPTARRPCTSCRRPWCRT
eukprot:1422970-Rhodomonas_salina.2